MTEPDDLAWRGGHYLAVYGVLNAIADSACVHPPRGAEGAIGRAQCHFRRIGAAEALARLETISVILFRFRQALLARAETDREACRAALADLAYQWLLEAPMFPAMTALEEAA